MNSVIAPDNGFFFFFFAKPKSIDIFLISNVGTHKKPLAKGLLMSTYNIYFQGEIRKIFISILLLSGSYEFFFFLFFVLFCFLGIRCNLFSLLLRMFQPCISPKNKTSKSYTVHSFVINYNSQILQHVTNRWHVMFQWWHDVHSSR